MIVALLVGLFLRLIYNYSKKQAYGCIVDVILRPFRPSSDKVLAEQILDASS